MESQKGIKFLEELKPDAVIFDPPRTGLSGKIIQKINEGSYIKKIIYVSCNPSTLARDLNLLIKGGFSIKSIKLIDMFPQTYHIESITILER